MSGLISPALKEQIRAANDIVEVVGTYLPLKRAGTNFVALCPFHKEKSPSFNVSPDRQIFHCFGCHKGGDVFTFVQEYEHITFIEALRRLAERAKIPLQMESSSGQEKAHFLKETLLQIHEQITQRWQAALTNDAAGQIARDYLARRHVSAEAVKLFRLGYAPDAWDDTVNWSRGRGFELATVEQAGLIIRKEGESRYYDRFRGRLMFPICDEQGRVIAFSGRVLTGDEKTAKYVNSPETPLFTKGKVIFGLDKARRALLDAGFGIICEGQLDMIACYMAGVQNIVAPQGTALTADHARILKRYVDEVILCFDSDSAGQNAMLRALDDLLVSGLAIRVATIPAPHDPDSFIKENGGDAFRALIGKAQSFFDFLLDALCRSNDVGSDRGRTAVVRGMADAVHKTKDAVLADTYAQKTAQRLGVSVEAVRVEFKKASARAVPNRTPEAAAATEQMPSEEIPRPSQPEFWLLRYLLLDDTLGEWALHYLDLSWLQNPLVRQVIEKCLLAHADGRWHGVAALLEEFPQPNAQQLITEAASVAKEIPNRLAQLQETTRRLRDQWIDRQIAESVRKLNDPLTSDAERRALFDSQSQLRAMKGRPLEPLAEGG